MLTLSIILNSAKICNWQRAYLFGQHSMHNCHESKLQGIERHKYGFGNVPIYLGNVPSITAE